MQLDQVFGALSDATRRAMALVDPSDGPWTPAFLHHLLAQVANGVAHVLAPHDVDAMLDRLMQRHHRITLTGESLRKASPKPKNLEPELDQN